MGPEILHLHAVRKQSGFTLLQKDIQLSLNHLLKNCFPPSELPWHSWWKSVTINWELISGLSILPHRSVYPCNSATQLSWLQCCTKSEIRKLSSPTLFFFFKILGPGNVHIHHWDFDMNGVESVGPFGKYCHLDNIKSSKPWTRDVFLCSLLEFLSPMFCTFQSISFVLLLLNLLVSILFLWLIL